jgi:hypothetical protein
MNSMYNTWHTVLVRYSIWVVSLTEDELQRETRRSPGTRFLKVKASQPAAVGEERKAHKPHTYISLVHKTILILTFLFNWSIDQRQEHKKERLGIKVQVQIEIKWYLKGCWGGSWLKRTASCQFSVPYLLDLDAKPSNSFGTREAH